jgi:riboflavin synthase
VVLAPKGSIAVDGVSLTIVNPRREAGEARFDVAVIPHTRRETAMQHLAPGETVNVEFDILAKQVDAQIRAYLEWTRK